MRPFPPCGTQTGTGFARVPRRPGGVRAGRCSAAWVTEPAWRAAGVTILWSPLRGQQHPVQQVPRAEELAGLCTDTPEVRATQRRPGCSPLPTDARNSQAGARAPAQGPKRQRPGRPAEARTRRSGKSRAAGPPASWPHHHVNPALPGHTHGDYCPARLCSSRAHTPAHCRAAASWNHWPTPPTGGGVWGHHGYVTGHRHPEPGAATSWHLPPWPGAAGKTQPASRSCPPVPHTL